MRVTRENIHQVLVDTKWHLGHSAYRGSGHTFMCFAVEDAARQLVRMYGSNLEVAARNVITDRLGRHRTVETWLEEVVGKRRVARAKEKDPDVIQKFRHRWLDALIEEFSTKKSKK
jgi:hypothetical protein